jgi:hypothetical protein
MTLRHRYFEVKCALAASGQLSDLEFCELSAHLRRCDQCRYRLMEMALVSSQIFLARRSLAPRPTAQKGMLERFTQRAIGEGIPLRQPRRAPSVHHLVGATAFALLSVLLIVMTWTAANYVNSANSLSLADGPGLKGLLHGPGVMIRPTSSPDPVVAVKVSRPPGTMRRSASRRNVEARRLNTGSNAKGSVMPETSTLRDVRTGFPACNADRLFYQKGTDTFTLVFLPPWPSTPRPFPVFLSSSSTFDLKPVKIEDLFLDQKRAAFSGKRVLIYNSGMASLTLLDPIHTAAFSMPDDIAERIPAFRFTLPAAQ